MRTSPRRSRLPGFGLVDSLMGLFILLVGVSTLYSGYSALSAVTTRQQAAVQDLAGHADGESHAQWY